MGCGGRLRKPSAYFSSPNYPRVYPLSVECLWYITVDFGMSIELSIIEYDIEGAPNCHWDSLTVYGGEDTTAPQLTQLCQKKGQKTLPLHIKLN